MALAAEDLIDSIPAMQGPGGFGCDRDTSDGGVYFMDDIAVSVSDPTPNLCVIKAKRVTPIIIHVLCHHALALNFKPGKTACSFKIRGKASRRVKTDIVGPAVPVLSVASVALGRSEIFIVPHYKHWGSVISPDGNLDPEIRHRCGAGKRNI